MTVVEVIIVEEAQTPSAAAIVVEFPVEVAVRRQEVERMVLVEPGRVVTEEEEEVMRDVDVEVEVEIEDADGGIAKMSLSAKDLASANAGTSGAVDATATS